LDILSSWPDFVITSKVLFAFIYASFVYNWCILWSERTTNYNNVANFADYKAISVNLSRPFIMLNKTHLKDKVKLIEKQMLLKLEEIRKTFDHKGLKGGLAETELRAFLSTYLPKRLSVGTGEVIDRTFNTSKQMDVVIANEDHPFTFQGNDPALFFIEGVCAVGEVKSILTTEQLMDGLEKATHYKKLKMIPPKGAITMANESDGRRYYTTPPFFIFAYESQITLDLIAQTAYNYDAAAYSPGFSADGIFVLGKGIVIDLGDGKGTMQMKDNGVSQTGWKGMKSETVLYDLLLWLTIVMPRMVGGSNILTPYLMD
jgi:hypothetical protein